MEREVTRPSFADTVIRLGIALWLVMAVVGVLSGSETGTVVGYVVCALILVFVDWFARRLIAAKSERLREPFTHRYFEYSRERVVIIAGLSIIGCVAALAFGAYEALTR